MPTVREAAAHDAGAVADVHVRSWKEGYRGLISQEFLDGLRAEEWAGRYAFDEMDIAGPYTLVAVDGNEILGHITVGRSRDDDRPGSAEVWSVYVDPRRWGAGVGDALLSAGCDRLSAAGYDRAFLWVLAANRRARRFYEHAGWQTDGRKRTIDIGGSGLDEISYGIGLPARPLGRDPQDS